MFSASTQALIHRTTSSFPLSIGTALAFESLFDGSKAPYDPDRVKPERVSLDSYDTIWINVATLYRNILGSVESQVAPTLMAGDILDVMIEELDIIRDIVRTHTNDRVKVVFYRSLYEGLKRAHPQARLRVDNTAKQTDYTAQLTAVLNQLYKAHRKELDLHEFARGLEPKATTRALVITHIAYDLLSYKAFPKLDLLESHTGVLKTRVSWYTKLVSGKELTRIPFNACMMQVFGDSQTFHPMPIATRRAVMDLSNQYQWHALSTQDRLRFCFDTLQDRGLAESLKAMLNE